jgi:hypothetical protein
VSAGQTAMNTVDRLELSRARLRTAMSPPPPPTASDAARNKIGRRYSWLRRLRDLPVVALVVESLGAWWANHPLHAAGQVAAQASGAVVRPVAARHPIALVLGAGLAGVLLVWSRPWRWALRPALLAGLAPQFTARVLAHLPVESWLTLLASTLSAPIPSEPVAAASVHP